MTTPTLTPWQATLDGLLLGPGTPYELADVSGLGELPAVSDEDEDLAGGDGEYHGDDTVRGRTITLAVEVAGDGSTTLAAALAVLEMVTRPKRDVELWALLPTWSSPRRCTARVRRRAMRTDDVYEAGLSSVAVQLRAADPVLYGPDVTASTGFPQPVGGLRYPLYTDGAGANLGWLDYGPSATRGRIMLGNSGSADVWPWFEVLGPTPPGGFALVRTDDGARVQFEAPVGAGALLRLDSIDGSAVIDGVSDRGGALTWRDWWPVRAGEQVEVAFLPLGPWTAAQLTPHSPSGWW